MEGLVSGGQEVGHARQGGKGSRPLGIGGRLGQTKSAETR